MTPFFGKRCFFDMVEKVRFTNCVFEKLCFPENTIFIVSSAKHSSSKTKKIMKNSGLFLNMAEWCFLGVCFFEVSILKGCFWCVWYCFKSVKNACFSQFFGFFLGWLIVVHLSLEGLGVFVFLVFVFLFCLAFVSVLFALFLVLWLDVVFFLFLFVLFVFVCFFWRV